MNVTEPFVLRSGVLLIPCAELSDDVRRRISFNEGDFTLQQAHGRMLAQVIDGGTAALLALFREPRTIVDAVIENSRALNADAEARLDEVLPHLGVFVENRVLVPAGAAQEDELRPRYDTGAEVGGWRVVRCVSLMEDSEVYQLHDGTRPAALKIGRKPAALRPLFDNEVAVLRHLDGSGIAPRPIGAGDHEERPYLIAEWIDGVDAGVAATQRRHDRAALLDICISIATAYASLHERGVLHGDVHPRNVLVGQTVTLLDFGYARFAGEPMRGSRAGVHYYFEPEYLAARRRGETLPPSAAGEQYAIAALLYFLITGSQYLDFRYEREEMARQVETDPPLPFAARGIPPWPDVEQILFRALRKDPSQRHRSVAEMAAVLAEARDNAAAGARAVPLSAEAEALLETTLRSFARGGEAFAARYPSPPTASINFGCAGAAAAMLRVAQARSDTKLLALADVWRSRAAALIGSEGAYSNDDTLPLDVVGSVTPYHTESGIHAVAAMIAASRGETFAHQRAVAAFIESSTRPCPNLDLTLGRSGSLLASSMLLELAENAELRAFGAETMRSIWEILDRDPPLQALPADTYLGLAHGWAGYFYAALRWCAASGDALPPRLVERLHDYAAMNTLDGRGAYWRIKAGFPPTSTMFAAWCHGSAGQLFLFTLAHRLLGDDRWLELAELCAWDTWDQQRHTSSLCCGTAGRSYALLNFYKNTGETAWLGRARELANHAASALAADAPHKRSLWKGPLGVAVLIADLASPENARMPFFE